MIFCFQKLILVTFILLSIVIYVYVFEKNSSFCYQDAIDGRGARSCSHYHYPSYTCPNNVLLSQSHFVRLQKNANYIGVNELCSALSSVGDSGLVTGHRIF